MFWLVLILCLLISFIFSGIEAGILSINRVRLRHRARLRDRAAIRLEALLRHPERLLLTVLIVTNFLNIVAITLGTEWLVDRIGPWGHALALAIFLPLVLFGLELFPKSLFRRVPEPALAVLSQPLRWADQLLSPLLRLGTRLARRAVPQEEHPKLFGAREDFKYFTLESEQAGSLTTPERQLIHNVVDFRPVTARSLMLPLSQFPTVHNTATVDDLIRLRQNASLFLLASDTGEIAGVVNLFDAVLERPARVSSIARGITSVAATETAFPLLRRLRASRTPVLLVMEEGEPVGLILRDTVYRRLLTMEAKKEA